MEKTTVVSTPILGLLGIAFIVLKLCGVINWSWWLVLLPIYGPIVLTLIAVCIIVCGLLSIK